MQVSPSDTAVPVVTTLDGAVAMANNLFRASHGETTLSGGCLSNATTCSVSNASGVSIGNGICFSAPCSIVASATGGPPPTSLSLSAGEVALVTAVAGNTLTLKRASIGTAASYLTNQGVTILNAGSYSQQAANIFSAAVATIVQNSVNGAYTATTQAAVIAAAQGTLQAAH